MFFFLNFLDSAQNASTTGAASAASASAATRKSGMALDEAIQILNLEKNNLKQSEILKRYEIMFKANDPKEGGSLYLQSKVYRAKERLDMELNSVEQKKD